MIDLSEYPPQYHTALKLLIPLWRGLDSDYKSKYARSIWAQWESNIKSAAYTATASKFYSNLCGKLPIAIESSGLLDVQEALAVAGDEERRLLRQLREETATLALMVRINNEARKSEWKARQAKRADEEKSPAIYAGTNWEEAHEQNA